MLQSAAYRALYTAVFFLANLLLANILLPANFGTISLMILNGALLNLITGLGADGYMMHALNNNKWTADYAISFILKIIAIQLFVFLIFEGFTFLLFKTTLLSGNNNNFLLIEVVYFTGVILLDKYVVLFYSRQKALLANLILLVNAIIYLTLLIVSKSFFPLSTYNYFIIFAFQSFVQALLLALIYHWNKRNIILQKINWLQLIEYIKLSSVIMITNAIQFFAYRIDFWLIEKYYSTYEVGVYAQANKFANLIWIVPNIFAFLLMAKFKHIDRKKIPVIFRFSAVSGLLLTVLTTFLAIILYNNFLNPVYKAGLMALYIMLPGYFFWSMVIYLGAYFAWMGKFHYNLLASSFCFVTITICDFILIPKLGITGAAISNSLAYTLTLILYVFIYYKESKQVIFLNLLLGKNDFYELKKILK